MFKALGCILILISCSGLGFLKASGYKSRSRELENTLELIQLLQLEITYKRDALPKSFQKVAALKSCWFSDVLRTCSFGLLQQEPLRRAWETAIEENRKGCPLLPQDIEILRDMSLGLGRSDVQGQKKIFEPAIVRIQAGLCDAAEQERKQGRMYRSLGISTGIVIAILFL